MLISGGIHFLYRLLTDPPPIDAFSIALAVVSIGFIWIGFGVLAYFFLRRSVLDWEARIITIMQRTLSEPAA